MQNRLSSLTGSVKSEGVSGNGDALTTALGDENFYLPFFQYITVSKNTAALSYQTSTMVLPISQSERLWVEFPKGCAGLVGLQLYHGTEQIFPLPSSNWLKSDGFVFSFRFSHLWNKEPFTVEARTYNLDDTYNHTIWFALELHGLPKGLNKTMQSFLKTLQG